MSMTYSIKCGLRESMILLNLQQMEQEYPGMDAEWRRTLRNAVANIRVSGRTIRHMYAVGMLI
ncbi:MAG: hypothetical protein QME46_07855 [Thermoanaerobacteraceae bacterium]|nr:hypothetical protein [Thermoanaerobacteraceae bacterium]